MVTAEAWGVATFYHLFRTEPSPPIVAHVCDDIACRLHGAEAICAALDAAPKSDQWTWHRSPCLGQCDRAPAALMIRAGTSPSADTLVEIKDAAVVISSLRSPAPTRAPHVARLNPGPTTGLVDRINNADPHSVDS